MPAHPRSTTRLRNIAWLLKQNKRFSPLLNTVFKLTPFLTAVGAILGIVLWTWFSDYLGLLGQAALPVTQAGDWLFLLIFGVLAALAVATIVLMPAVWTLAVRSIATTASAKAVQVACFTVAVATIVVLSIATYAAPQWEFAGIVFARLVGGVSGGLVMSNRPLKLQQVVYYSAGHALSALILIIWLTFSGVLLVAFLEPFAATWKMAGIFIIIVPLCALLALYIKVPPLGVLMGLISTFFWIVYQASPEKGILIPSGLYTALVIGSFFPFPAIFVSSSPA